MIENQNKIVLSICIPTYNRAKHIKRLIKYLADEIESIDLSLIEVIVSNNASTDSTKEILAKAGSQYSWLRINNNEKNIGAHANMLLLYSISIGKYIWIPGDDDYLKKGLLKSILSILTQYDLSYLYLSRRCIKEENHKINFEGKTHYIEYDKPIKVTHDQLCRLICENYSDLKFQTSSIFKRANIEIFENEAKSFSEPVQANCHSIFRAIRSMQCGQSYFVSDISILSGDQISWGENIIDYMAIYDPSFCSELSRFGFTQNETNKFSRRQMAVSYASFLCHKDMYSNWIKKGKPGWSISIIPTVLFLISRKFLRLFGLSKEYSYVNIEFKDFE